MGNHYHYHYPRRRYGLGNLLVDIIGLCIFNIFWLIWMIVRETRR